MTSARGTVALAALAVGAVIACWLSSGMTPLRDVATGVRDPADFIRDYVTARARIEGGRGAPPEGESANDLGQRLGTPRVLLLGGPYFLHPPPALLAVLPLAWLPWHAAALVWAALSLVGLAWLAVSLLGIAVPDVPRALGPPPRAGRLALATALAAAIALWPPTLHCLEKGQWSIWIAALLAAGFRALESAEDRRAGVLFGVATALKATPAVLIILLVARSRRAAAAMLVTLAVIGVVALGVNGFAIWRAFVAEGPHDAAVWSTWLANTASLQGVYARLLAPGPFTRPLVEAPLIAQLGFIATALLALAAAIVTWPRRREPPGLGAAAADVSGDRATALWSAAWLTLPVVLNPLGWTHVLLMLLAPIMIAFRDGERGTRIGVAFVLAVLSIPRQRLISWAGPMPVGPGAGLVLGAHAVAGIALFVMLLGDSLRARRDAGFARAVRDRHFQAFPTR